MAKQTFTTGQVLTAAQMTSLQQTAMLGGDTTAKTTSYTLVAADAGTTVAMSNAGSTTITVNTSLFAAGDIVTIQNRGAGVCTITAGTATIDTSGSLILAQYQGGVLYFTSTSAAIFFQFATPESGDISGVTAGTGLSGGGTSGTVTVSINTGVTADLTTAQTLTNKTLTSPIISTISNTGTLTLPTSTDTIVGRATTDTLTNKTLTSPVINGGLINLSLNAQTGTTYTLVAADSGKLVTCSNASPITLTVPPSVYSAGEQINIAQTGAGQVTFAQGAGVTIVSIGATASAPKIAKQYGAATVICTASNTFLIIGGLS